MSKLDELIEKLCPDGVEYKTLAEIGTITRGNGLKKSDFTESGVQCIHYGQIYTYYGTFTNTTKSFVSKELAKTLKKVNKDDIIIAVTSENLDDVCKCVAWLGDEEIVTGGHTAIFKHNQNAKFIAYWLQTRAFFAQKAKIAQGTKVIEVTPSKLEKILIPVPPMEVQREIVRILDNFTELTEELTAELTARKKQYEHYRDSLLVFGDDENVNWMILGDVLTIKNGKDYKSFPSGDIPVYGTGGIINYIDRFAYNKPSVLIPRKGSIGKLYYLDTPFWTVDTIFYTDINTDIVVPKYIYYYLKMQHLENLNTAGGVPSLTQTVLNKVQIPVPPLLEQERIVAILDRFDALCNDISIGLPAEIEARKKQYEYYRDKLLSFEEKVA